MDSSYFFDATTYWSEYDEQVHFDWMRRVACVRDVRGVGSRVYLDVDEAAANDEDVRELIAVYFRYGGDLRQLLKLAEGRPAVFLPEFAE